MRAMNFLINERFYGKEAPLPSQIKNIGLTCYAPNNRMDKVSCYDSCLDNKDRE